MSTTAQSTVENFDPRSREYFLDPAAAVQCLFDENRVMFCEPVNAYFIAGYEETRQVLKDVETYSSLAYKGVPVRAELRAGFRRSGSGSVRSSRGGN